MKLRGPFRNLCYTLALVTKEPPEVISDVKTNKAYSLHVLIIIIDLYLSYKYLPWILVPKRVTHFDQISILNTNIYVELFVVLVHLIHVGLNNQRKVK